MFEVGEASAVLPSVMRSLRESVVSSSPPFSVIAILSAAFSPFCFSCAGRKG